MVCRSQIRGGTMLKKVYICSPLGGNISVNLEKAKLYAKYALKCGTAPVVPHFYALCLNDDDPRDRELGVTAGLSLLLWLYDEPGGIQANFSGCLVSNYDFSDRSLNSSILNNAKFVNCNFTNAELCFSIADHTKFVDCSMIRITGEEMSCRSTKFKGCNLFMAMLTHSNFSDALFSRTSVSNANFTNCCIDNTEWIHTDENEANLRNISMDEQAWSDEDMNMTM